MNKNKLNWLIWCVLLAFYIYMAAGVMPSVSASLLKASSNPECVIIPDLKMFGISEAELMETFTCMGESGRSAYRLAETQADILYPFAYGLFFAFTIWHLTNFLYRNSALAWKICVFPLLGMVADYIENYHFIQLIDAYPAFDSSMVSRASLFNSIKWGFALPSMAIMLLGAVASLIRLVSKKSAH